MKKCSIIDCQKDAGWIGLCDEHETEFNQWKRGLMFRYGDKPNEWALLTSFLLSKEQIRRK